MNKKALTTILILAALSLAASLTTIQIISLITNSKKALPFKLQTQEG